MRCYWDPENNVVYLKKFARTAKVH